MTTKLVMLMAAAVLSCPLFGQGGFEGPGRYEITNLKSGKVLDLDRNNPSSVIQFAPLGNDNQAWDIRPAANGFFYLRNGMNGFALDAGGGGKSEPVRGLPFNGSEAQQWRFEPGKDGNALITSRLGRTLDIPDGSNRDAVRVQIYDVDGDSNQRFSFRRLSGGRDWDARDEGRGRNDRGASGAIVCSSDHGDRVYCAADVRYGVQLVRQLSGSPCEQGRTWGADDRGIWVDRGCRAEFAVNAPRGDSRGNRITCSSNHGERVYCEVDTRGMVVQLARQISGDPCEQGRTWGADRRGVWVDRGCRAEFVLVPDR